MLNIFYNPIYYVNLYEKILLTRQIKHSVFFKFIVYFFHYFNLIVPDWLIVTGPQMRMKHLLKTFKNTSNISFNKNKYDNNYIVQFDKFGEKILKKIIKNRNKYTKILVGPLYGHEEDKILNSYIQKYHFIKKIVASEYALEAQRLHGNNLDLKNIIILPSGIINEKDIKIDIDKKKKFDCLVYFKRRDRKDLESALRFLEKQKLKYKVIEYGNYKVKELKELASISRFGLVIDKTESQGFGIQSLMAQNLPLIVWDYRVNEFYGYKINGSSVPWWDDDKCGIKISSINELENKFSFFLKNLNEFNPSDFVKAELTYEKFQKNINNIFKNETIWNLQKK